MIRLRERVKIDNLYGNGGNDDKWRIGDDFIQGDADMNLKMMGTYDQ